MSLGQQTHKKGTGVMPSAFVLCAGVAEPDDESDGRQGLIVLAAVSGIVCRRCVGIAVAANLVAFVSAMSSSASLVPRAQ